MFAGNAVRNASARDRAFIANSIGAAILEAGLAAATSTAYAGYTGVCAG